MSSIVFNGQDFSTLCSARVVGRALNGLSVEALRIAGRPGALPVRGHLPPEDVRVRLFLDPRFDPGVCGLSHARHVLRSWLGQPGGGTLVLPDDPEFIYRDAFLVEAGEWSQLFEDGQCDVTFTLFDPVACGAERAERTASFEVGGTWETLPTFSLTACAGDSLAVSCAALGASIALEHAFAGGEAVVIDCEAETATVDGADASGGVTLGSDFFALQPGPCELAFLGCSSFETRFVERWL